MKDTKSIILNRGSTLFLRAAIAAIGLVTLAICIFALPPTWIHVPDEYPDISYAFYVILSALYVATVPFFFALYQGLLLLGYVDKNKAFSQLSVKALKRIAYCGGAIGVLFVALLPFFYIWAESDDAPGLIIICMAFAVASFAVAVAAGVLQRLLKEAIKLKSENELTV
jgi:hypothetical protein